MESKRSGSDPSKVWQKGDKVYVYNVYVSKYIRYKRESWERENYKNDSGSCHGRKFYQMIFENISNAIGRDNVVDCTNPFLPKNSPYSSKGPCIGYMIMTTVEIPDKVAQVVCDYKNKNNPLYQLVDFVDTERFVGDLLAAQLDGDDQVYHDKVYVELGQVWLAEELYFEEYARYLDTGCCGSTVTAPRFSTCLVGTYKGKIMGEMSDRVDLYHANWWRKSHAARTSIVAKLGHIPLGTIDLVHADDIKNGHSSRTECKFNWCLGFGWDRDISDENRFEKNPFKADAPRWHGSLQEAIFKRVIELDSKTDKIDIDKYHSKSPMNVLYMIHQTVGMIPVVSSDTKSKEYTIVSDWAKYVHTLFDQFEAQKLSKPDLAIKYRESVQDLCKVLEGFYVDRSKYVLADLDGILPWKHALIRRLTNFKDCESFACGMEF
jgi:hypothetical protein